MLDLSVIILTYNEEIHIARCLDNVKSIAKHVFIVDSLSTDKTCENAGERGALVYQNKWPGNQAAQFNWALDNLPIETKWVLRLDADEYLTEELLEELRQNLENVSDDVTGVVLKRRHVFLGKWIKRGTYPVKLLRIFQYKKAVCEQRLMDEHIQLLEGRSIEFNFDFVDDNQNDLGWWTVKHNNYAIREAIDLLDLEYNLFPREQVGFLAEQAAEKRAKKISYAKKPLFVRSFAYFVYRYFFKLGFTEGKEGFLWHFLQGWWYRTLVDAKVFEIKKNCGNDKSKIISYLKSKYDLYLF